jgi:homoserine acetyltransferase
MGDVSKVKAVAPSLQGDLAGVLRNVKAKGLIMPCKTDLYFPVGFKLHS